MREILALGELDAVRRGLHAVVTDLARVADRVEEVGMHGRLAAGELHRHLAARLDHQRVIEDFLNFFPAQLVDVADLVRVHEAGIAHHVAAVREVDRQNRAAAVAHRAAAVTVQLSSLCAGNVASGEILLDPREEFRVHGHQVFAVAMDRAFLHHPDLAVALDDLRLDLADLLMNEVGPILLAAENRVARLGHAAGAQRIGRTRPAESRLALLVGLQQRLIGPLRSERRVRIEFIEELN